MFQIITTMNRYLHRRRDRDKEQSVQYNPEKIESILKEFDELSTYATDLEKLLQIAEKKTHAYEDILQKYQRLFQEQINAYQLQETDLSLLTRNYDDNESFLQEIQHHLQVFAKRQSESDEQECVLSRLLERFFHQNELYKMRTRKKLTELNEAIEQKRRMLERIQSDLVSWDRHVQPAIAKNEPTVQLKRAFG